jgi:hypothetical protein
LSDGEVLDMFFPLHGESTGRNISERHKIVQIWKFGNENKGSKHSISAYLKENLDKNLKLNIFIFHTITF